MSAGRNGQDEHVSRRSGWLPVAWGVGLAVAGAGVAFVLAGGPWAAGGAVVGAIMIAVWRQLAVLQPGGGDPADGQQRRDRVPAASFCR